MKKIIILIIVVQISGCNRMDHKMKIIGHRGAMGHETENTLASVRKAMELNVDMIEIDVFRIKSGEIVVFHDDRLDRLSDARGLIEEYDLDELKKVILKGDHNIPTLREVLDLMEHSVPLNIELKGANTSVLVNEIIREYIQDKGWQPDDFLISSFNWEELKSMRSRNPQIAIAVLTEGDPLEAIPVARQLGAVAINPNFGNVSSENVRTIHKEGFEVYVWTVNEVIDIQRMRAFEVDGIFTNFPERAH